MKTIKSLNGNMAEDIKFYIRSELITLQRDEFALRNTKNTEFYVKLGPQSHEFEKSVEELCAQMGISVNQEEFKTAVYTNLNSHIEHIQKVIHNGTRLVCKILKNHPDADVSCLKRTVETLKAKLWNEFLIPNATVEMCLTMMEDAYDEYRSLISNIHGHYEHDIDCIANVAALMDDFKRRIHSLYNAGVDYKSDKGLYNRDFRRCSFHAIEEMCHDINRMMIALRDEKNRDEKWYEALL
jgi:hypothetical protein